MSALGANLPPQFGVFGCANWQFDGSIQKEATLVTAGESGWAFSGIKATDLAPTAWIGEGGFAVDSSADSSISFGAELVGTSDLLSPVDTQTFFNNLGIVQGSTNGGGAISVYDEGGLISADARELDFIGAGIQAALQGQNRINITSSGGLGDSFETVNQNLRRYPYTLGYTGSLLTTVVYTVGANTITKTLAYTGTRLDTITLSGTGLPTGIATTKTLNYTGTQVTSVSYA